MSTEQLISIDEAFLPIARKVRQIGDLQQLSSWQQAFPDVPFDEVDEVLTGKPMEWETRPLDDRYVYVAMYRGWGIERRRVVVDYTLEHQGDQEHTRIDDSERQWYLLFDGALRVRGETGRRTVAGLDTLAYYATQNGPFSQEMLTHLMPDLTLRRLTISIPKEVVDELA